MSPDEAILCIKRIAITEDKVYLTDHAKKRNPSAGKSPLTKIQIINCIRHGFVTEGPYKDLNDADYLKCTVTRRREGEEHEVVLSFKPEDRIVVITGYECRKRARGR